MDLTGQKSYWCDASFRKPISPAAQ